MVLTEKGTLPVGVDYDGKTHREFEIREELTGDMIAVFDDEAIVARGSKNDAFLGLCILSKQILSIGTMPPDALNHELLLGMHRPDFAEIQRASKRLEEKRRSFRVDEEGQIPSPDGHGAD